MNISTARYTRSGERMNGARSVGSLPRNYLRRLCMRQTRSLRYSASVRTLGCLEANFAHGFIDILPLRPGHTLVIPKTHISHVSDLPPETAAAMGMAVSKVAKALTQGECGFMIRRAWTHASGFQPRRTQHSTLYVTKSMPKVCPMCVSQVVLTRASACSWRQWNI